MFLIKTLFIYRAGLEGKGQVIPSGLDSASAALYLSAVLHNPSKQWSASLHQCRCAKAIVAILCSSLCSHIIWESQCDLQAYITSHMSQHAHQEGSMVEEKEHSIWCQTEQVQFLHLPLLVC